MTDKQWEKLKNILTGKETVQGTTGFIIDSPWLPGWNNLTKLQYYTSDDLWYQTNKKAIEAFPDTFFLPWFWSEYGMCTEPSAFGAKLSWHEDSLPWAGKIIPDIQDINTLEIPDPKTDGLLPFMIQRLKNTEEDIRALGHRIRFAVARGPLNIASYLRGTTELMTDFMMYPGETSTFLDKITHFTIQWLQYQKEQFPSIEGIMILDDLIGFVGEQEFISFVLPRLKEIFGAFDAGVRLLHNDAQGLITARYLSEMNVNIFNFSHEHSLNEIRDLAGPEVILLGNLPPRDVLAAGTPETVARETEKMMRETKDQTGIIWSCGGGMPPEVSTENIQAFIETVKRVSDER